METIYNSGLLYAFNSNGKIKQWSIIVTNENKIIKIKTIHGYKDGKLMENERIVATGKNIGKINETTIEEQAIIEAKAKLSLKLDEGYTYFSEINEINESILPMLALDYNKRGHDISFPCYCQPKLDGVRCIVKNGKLYSRKGNEFSNLEFITKELNKYSNIVFDGELYSWDMPFQELVGLVKRKTSEDISHRKIYYVIYDIVNNNKYEDRLETINKVFYANKFKYIKKIDTYKIYSSASIDNLHDVIVNKNGYEGLMLRNINGVYKTNYRSKDLQKYKKFQDEEFKIVSFEEGDGMEKGCVIWVCEATEVTTFKVRPQGTRDERKELFLNGNSYIGKLLTVKYQGVSTGNIPRFPVGISIRDYE